MNIFGDRTLIRAIEKMDLPLLQEMLNDSAIEACVGGWSFPVSSAEQVKWYESIISDKNTKRFMIQTTDREEKLTIGMIYLTDFDWKNRSVSTGIKLSTSAPRRCGYATDAVRAVLRFVFYELQMNRVSLKILSNNQASIKLYEKCGAKKEGTARQAIFKNGAYIDQHYYAFLKEDFIR